MQEELGWTRSSLRKCIRPLVENGLRAHDDDPRVPVLDNRHGCEKPCYDAGSRARRLTVFSSFLFFCRLLGSEFQGGWATLTTKYDAGLSLTLPEITGGAPLSRVFSRKPALSDSRRVSCHT